MSGLGSKIKKAECHSDRPHYGRSMCKQCYERWYWKTSPTRRPKNLIKCRDRYHNNKDQYKKYAERRKIKRQQAALDRIKPCPICQKTQKLVYDHDHLTEKFRGYICGSCNFMLGHALDNPDTLRSGAIYLEAHNETH